MNFLKIEDEINFSQTLYKLKREIENFLHNEGYMNIEPSIFEGYDEFTDVNFRIDKKSTVKVFDNSGEILILSPDITTGIINKFMTRWELGLILKIFYYGKTYMFSNGIKEKRQMGVELIGEKNENTDESVLNTALKIINKYTDDYLIEIGNSKFLKGLIEACLFNKVDYDNVLNLIYVKNKQALKEYLEKLPYREPISTLLNILDLEGNFDEINRSLNGLYMNDLMKEGLRELYNIDEFFKNVTNKITYDLSMVSELSYYDGIIFRGYINGINKEIIKGGRYDSFTEQFRFNVPAIGFSIELDELMKYLYKGVI
ncbi:MAG: ATP phosphoribosyltransferase regulatory subunit [Tissierellia bacterium]|nr:ATP phosphoribosyltransferase regulatory subunit [Tissierellia bacterium]MDD4781609.1 ATP phosphoribosyltransferase regulatory subunit [Tissierellia bacterium]